MNKNCITTPALLAEYMKNIDRTIAISDTDDTTERCMGGQQRYNPQIIFDSGANINASSMKSQMCGGKSKISEAMVNAGAGQLKTSGIVQLNCKLGSFNCWRMPGLDDNPTTRVLYQCRSY